MPSRNTITVQSFEVDASFSTIQKHCESTHKQISQYISNEIDALLRKGEKKWVVSLCQFNDLITSQSKQNACRFRLRVDVNDKVAALSESSAISKGVLLSCLLYQIALYIENDSKKKLVTALESKI